MAAPEPPSSVFGPLPEYRLNLTEPLDRARQLEAGGDLDGALLIARPFFEATVARVVRGGDELVPNAASAARCIARCLLKQRGPEPARQFLEEARERLCTDSPGVHRLRARLQEEEARLLELGEALSRFRAQSESFRDHARPGLQSHALPLATAARRVVRGCGEMAAPALAAGALGGAARTLLTAPSTDLRALLSALELLAEEMDRMGSPAEAAILLREAGRRAGSALALLRTFFGASAAPHPVARLLRLEAACRRRAGEAGEARSLLRQLARLQPGEAAVELALLGEFGEALEELKAAAPPPEEVPFVLEFRSLLLRRLGREAEARQAAAEALVLCRAPERLPLADEWYPRWLSGLSRLLGEHRRLRLQEAAGEAVGPALEALAADLARSGLEVRSMERGVADEAAGHLLLRAGRREAAFHSFHRALEAYRGEEWEASERIYEDDFLMLDGLGREEALLRLADPRWRYPPERVEVLMRSAFAPDEFRRFGDHSVEDYFATLLPGPLDRDPEEVTAEIRLPGAPRP